MNNLLEDKEHFAVPEFETLVCLECGQELSQCEIDEEYAVCSDCDTVCRCRGCKESAK